MTATSMAPYFDLGVIVEAELALTVVDELEVVLEPELVVVVEPAEVVFVPDPDPDPEPLAVDIVVAVVELPLLVTVADEVAVVLADEEDPVEVLTVALVDVDDPVELSAKTPPVVEDWMLEVTEDAGLADDETAWPLQEPEILMLW